MATGWPMKTTYANGDVYSASDVNDITGTINLLGSSVAYTAGKNKIINGDFGIWQRGTSFTNPTDTNYLADRYQYFADGSGKTVTVSRQTFTPGTAPVAGYEGQYFLRIAQTVAGTGATYNALITKMENVQTFAGQKVTFSFWAKASTARTLPSINIFQDFGSGGSSRVSLTLASSVSLTTSWTRFSYTTTLGSLTGKTIGTSSYLGIEMNSPLNSVQDIDFWGWQLEQGSTATAFQTATGTIQGELAACQRYYVRYNAEAAYTQFGTATPATSGTTVYVAFPLAVPMRVAPTVLDYIASYASLRVQDGTNFTQVTGLSINNSTSNLVKLNTTVASGLTQYRPYFLISDNSTSPYIGFGAEL